MTKFYEVPTSPIVFAPVTSTTSKSMQPSFVYSCNDVGKDVHVHITEPNQETFDIANILNTDTDVRCTFSYNEREEMLVKEHTMHVLDFLFCLFFYNMQRKS